MKKIEFSYKQKKYKEKFAKNTRKDPFDPGSFVVLHFYDALSCFV